MFSETRYARNGDLHVAYRASREGPRDIVVVPAWFTCCEDIPELPSIQGWLEAMTSLGRVIFFDQPGTGVSDPVTPGALPTLEQWGDSVTVRSNTSVPHHRAGRPRGLRRSGQPRWAHSGRILRCHGRRVGDGGV